MTESRVAQSLLRATWNGSLPIEIRLSPAECRVYDQADPYLVTWLWLDSCGHKAKMTADSVSATVLSSLFASSFTRIFLCVVDRS